LAEALLVICWLFTALLIVLFGVCLAASRGAIRRNRLVGIRIPSVMRDDSAWRSGHRAGIVPSGIAAAAALMFSAAGLLVPALTWGAIVAFAGGVAWTFVSANRAASAPERVHR